MGKPDEEKAKQALIQQTLKGLLENLNQVVGTALETAPALRGCKEILRARIILHVQSETPGGMPIKQLCSGERGVVVKPTS